MMLLKEYLVADLKRLHYLSGKNDLSITRMSLVKACLGPRFMPVAIFRFAHVLFCNGWPGLAKFFSFLNFFMFGLEVAPQIPIGPGLFFPHTQGTVIGARSIGSNATIFQQVTVGASKLDMAFDMMLRPTIGDNVVLGSGAKILGGIFIGNDVTVGANSVVVSNIPNCVTCAGIPARVITKHQLTEAETVHA